MTNDKDSGGAFAMPAEPTVQVPVSLIELAVEALDDAHMRTEGPEPGPIADSLRGFLSQPNPTAEPPRIEDMAPGTTEDSLDAAWNEYTADSRGKGLLFGMDKSPREAFIVGFRAGSRIDPSTIRDVTPPTQETK